MPCYSPQSMVVASLVRLWTAMINDINEAWETLCGYNDMDHMDKLKLCWRLFHLIKILFISLYKGFLLLNKKHFRGKWADRGIWKGKTQEKLNFQKNYRITAFISL